MYKKHIIVPPYFFKKITTVSTYFMPLVSFDTPRKHQQTRGFLMFSRVQKETSGMKRVKGIRFYEEYF